MGFKLRDSWQAKEYNFRGLIIPDTSQEVGRMESEGVSCLKLGANRNGGYPGSDL